MSAKNCSHSSEEEPTERTCLMSRQPPSMDSVTASPAHLLPNGMTSDNETLTATAYENCMVSVKFGSYFFSYSCELPIIWFI